MTTYMHRWKFTLFEGILLLILGVFLLARPALTTYGLAFVAGWIAVIYGVVGGLRALFNREDDHFFITLSAATLFILIGILIINHPVATILTLTALFTALLTIEGISKLILFARLKHFKYRFFLLFSALISLLLAILIWTGWPDTTHWFLGLYFAISIIFAGISLIAFSLKVKDLG